MKRLRLVYNDKLSSYDELLLKANKNTLFIERHKRIALFVYKCTESIGPTVVHDLFDSKNIPYNLCDDNKTVQPKVNTTTFGLNSLKYSGSLLWNRLPPDLKSSITLSSFKTLLKSWEGPTCKCGVCLLCKSL